MTQHIPNPRNHGEEIWNAMNEPDWKDDELPPGSSLKIVFWAWVIVIAVAVAATLAGWVF